MLILWQRKEHPMSTHADLSCCLSSTSHKALHHIKGLTSSPFAREASAASCAEASNVNTPSKLLTFFRQAGNIIVTPSPAHFYSSSHIFSYSTVILLEFPLKLLYIYICYYYLHMCWQASAASSASWVVVKGSPKMLTLGSVTNILRGQCDESRNTPSSRCFFSSVNFRRNMFSGRSCPCPNQAAHGFFQRKQYSM